MSLSLSRFLPLAGSSLAAAALAIPFTTAVAQEEREIVIQRVVVEEKGEKEGKKEKEEKDDDDDKEKSPFWMGIALTNREDSDGLKIAEVYPDSPAQKAELKAGDVLIAIGDKKLERVEQLVDAVQDSKGRELKIKLVREGKEVVREVKPTRRPVAKEMKKEGERYAPKPEQPSAGPGPFSGIFRTERAPNAPRVTPPTPATGGGSAYPPGAPMGMPRMTIAATHSQLPDDMEVTISKKGSKPAVVVAKQGDKLWKTTENELGMLPPQAQAYATRMLGKDVRTRLPGPGAPGMSGAMMMQGMPGIPGMGTMSGAPTMNPPREVRSIELRLDKDGKIEALQGGKSAPHVKVLPSGGFQIEVREAGGKEVRKDGKADQPAVEKEDPDNARRIRELQGQAEQLRALLNKLREEVKE